MIIFILTFILTLFFYKNSLFFIMSLLLICFMLLSFLALHSYLNFLTVFMLIIVYVGAIMVLIGYVCAISPNLVLEPDFSFIYFFLTLLLICSLYRKTYFSNLDTTTFIIVDFFYNSQGIFIFTTLVLILFVTLLIVTSQYSVPKGPFRSIRL